MAGWPGKGAPGANSRQLAGSAQGSVIAQSNRKIFPDRKCGASILPRFPIILNETSSLRLNGPSVKDWYHPQFDRT
jgi:hypothetical protein